MAEVPNSFRGLIVSPPMIVGDGFLDLSSNASEIDPQEMKMNLLFWDKFSWPEQNLITIQITEHMQYLVETGVIERPKYPVESYVVTSDASSPNILKEMYLTEFEQREKKEPGIWSLSLGDKSLKILDAYGHPGRGGVIHLYRAIPVPDRSVPYQDILEFKERRYDELLELRLHIDDLYQKILSAGDGELALETEKARLQKSMANFGNAIQETRFPLRLSDLSASFSLSAGSISAFASTYAATLSLPAGLLAGVGASIGLSLGRSFSPRTNEATPFNYARSIHQLL